MGKSSFDWLELDNNSANPSDTDSAKRGVSVVGTDLKFWNGAAWSTVSGSGATTFVGLTDTPANYTAAANKILKVNTGGTAVEFVTLSGAITINATGVSAITAGTIVNADVNAAAAIAYSKLAALTDANILVGSAGNVATVVAVSGDVAMANDGSTTVTDLTISGEVQGNVIYFDGSNWVRLAVGVDGQFLMTQGAAADPIWSNAVVGTADKLSSPFTIEGGTNDPATTVTAQTVGAAALGIPDLANVAQDWVFTKVAQTLTNKTLTSPIMGSSIVLDQTTADYTFTWADPGGARAISIVDPGGADVFAWLDATQTFTNKTYTSPIIVTTDSIVDAGGDAYLTFVESGTPRDSVQITQGNVGVGAKIESITADANANLILDAAGSGDVAIANGTELTFTRATQDALIVVADQTGEDHTFNIPDIATGASDTFAFLAEAQTLTNKTIDVDANTVSNVNGDELDPINFGGVVYGIPVTIQVDVSNAATTTIYNANFPFKARIIDAYAVCTGGSAGTWKLDDGTNDITTAINYGSDTTVSRASSFDDSKWGLAANATLRCINSDAADDAILYITFLREA